MLLALCVVQLSECNTKVILVEHSVAFPFDGSVCLLSKSIVEPLFSCLLCCYSEETVHVESLPCITWSRAGPSPRCVFESFELNVALLFFSLTYLTMTINWFNELSSMNVWCLLWPLNLLPYNKSYGVDVLCGLALHYNLIYIFWCFIRPC